MVAIHEVGRIRSSMTVDAGALAVPGLRGIVICLMPLAVEGSDFHRRFVQDTFARQGHAVVFRDSGGPADRQGPPGALEQVVGGTIDEVGRNAPLARLSLGVFGLGPGAAPVLRAAVAWRARLRAVAVCGGRPQDGLAALPRLAVPTLLVVGGADEEALQAVDRAALRQVPGAWRLETVPGARSCLAEPGCFETAAHHAAAWFDLHFGRR